MDQDILQFTIKLCGRSVEGSLVVYYAFHTTRSVSHYCVDSVRVRLFVIVVVAACKLL